MTIDTRTEAERRYDAERDGSLYFTPAQPASDPNADEEEIIDLVSAALAYVTRDKTRPDERGYWEIPLGEIAGCAVEGRYHEHTLYSAELLWHGIQIAPQTHHGRAAEEEGPARPWCRYWLPHEQSAQPGRKYHVFPPERPQPLCRLGSLRVLRC